MCSMIEASALEGVEPSLASEIEAMQGVSTAVERSQAIIEFDVHGYVVRANQNFLDVLDYTAAEVVGKHHRMFCDPVYIETSTYRDFWDRLGRGEFVSGEFKRFSKSGKPVWLQATYNPILDETGKPVRVVKFAVDITDAKRLNAEILGKVSAIDRAQAVIEFDTTGVVLSANHNFCDLMGYAEVDVVGKHHRMFCDPAYAQTEAYADFWERLGAGEFLAGEYKRHGKGGREVWLQATYNPILDDEGKPFKIIKYASSTARRQS
jgi:methyl-accepting chemotaxis protein